MSFFEIVGLVVTSIFIAIVIIVIEETVKSILRYQRGARNIRKYVCNNEPNSRWYWFKVGLQNWRESFTKGSEWYTTVVDPEDERYDLKIFLNGHILRELAKDG